MCIVYHTFTYLKSGFCSAGSRPTLRPTTGKNGAGRKGYKSRFVRKFPRGKLKKGLESSGLRVWTLFVISRSPVRIRPSAPDLRHSCDGNLSFSEDSMSLREIHTVFMGFSWTSKAPSSPIQHWAVYYALYYCKFGVISLSVILCFLPADKNCQPNCRKNSEKFFLYFRQNASCFSAFQKRSLILCISF